MTTSFSFEHLFRAPDPQAILAVYFDPRHTALQDEKSNIVSREYLEVSDTGDAYRRVSKIVPNKQLPAMMRPFATGSLHYVEEQSWRRGTNEIHIVIRPSFLPGRAVIKAVYRLETAGQGLVRRTYAGTVSVEVSLLGGRIERGIIADMERSLVSSAAGTQSYLDAHPVISAHAQATGS